MKSLKNTLVLAALAFAMVFTACKKSVPKQTKYIPKDANLVFAINAKNFHEKLEKSKINLDSLIKSALAAAENAPTEMQQWEDIKNSGIQWQSEVFGYMLNKGAMMDARNVQFGLVAALDDATKFEGYLKKQMPGATVAKSTDFTYATGSGGFAAGWTKDILIIVNTAGAGNAATAAETKLAALFATKEAESVAGIPEFRELTASKSDLIMWSNATASLSAIPMIGLTKAADLFKDCYSATTLNFEDGKVAGEYTYYFGKVLTDIIKKHESVTIKMDALEKYPSNNITGFFSVAFKPELLLDIIKYMGVEAMGNQYLTSMGITIEDILKAFKGDITFVLSDFAVEEKPNPFYPSVTQKTPVFKMILNAETGDKAAFTKVAAALAQKGILVQQGNQYVPVYPTGAYKVTADEKNIFVASDSLILQQYKAGTGKAAIPDDVKSKSKGKTAVMYFDISKILKGIPSDSSYAPLLNQAQASFKDGIFTSDKLDGNKSKGYIELRTGNDKENSLATIVRFIQSAVDFSKTKRDINRARWEQEDVTVDDMAIDSVAAPVEEVRPR